MTDIIYLFYEFAKIGLFAVGGGLATLPFIYKLINIHPAWFERSQLLDMVAVAESTPGALGVNMAIYAGNIVSGPLGGIATAIGIITPSIFIILIVAHFFDKFKNSPIKEKIFYGIRPASIGLVLSSGLIVVKDALFNVQLYNDSGLIKDLFRFKSIIFAIVLYIGIVRLKKHPIFFIAIAAIVGNIIRF